MFKIKRSRIGNALCIASLVGSALVLGGYFGNPDADDHKNLLDFFWKISAILFPSSVIIFHSMSENIIKAEGYTLNGKDKTDFVNNTKLETMRLSKICMLLSYWSVGISAGIILPTLWFLWKSE
jgi:hypothetical protein